MSSHFLKTYEPFHTKTGAHVWDITLTFSVLQRVNPLTHFLLALLPRLSRFQVDPDGESDEWRMMELVVSEEAQPWFMGVVELDLGDLPFGVTQAWFPLKDSRKWRGPELNPRNRLRLGHIRPMAPIQVQNCLPLRAVSRFLSAGTPCVLCSQVSSYARSLRCPVLTSPHRLRPRASCTSP